MIRRLLRFLGWVGRQPGDIWPFPFSGFEPRASDRPILIDREGVAYLPERKVVLRAK